MNCGKDIIPFYLSTSSCFYNLNIKRNKYEGNVNFYGGRVIVCTWGSL